MAKKGGMPSYKTVDDYIAVQSEEAQIMLQEIRKIIHDSIPDVVELKDKKVPTFVLTPTDSKDIQLMMAAYAKFVSFYPFPGTTEAFAEQLKEYKQGKGSVQFPFNQPLPKELIAEMVKYRRDELVGF